jgi:hypothetical protein
MYIPHPKTHTRELNPQPTPFCRELHDSVIHLVTTHTAGSGRLSEFMYSPEFRLCISRGATYLQIASRKNLSAAWIREKISQIISVSEHLEDGTTLWEFEISGTAIPISYNDNKGTYAIAVQLSGGSLHHNEQYKQLVALASKEYADYIREQYKNIERVQQRGKTQFKYRDLSTYRTTRLTNQH